MNYQQTKTIQKYSINKNLLLLGLLVFASFVQGCGTTGKKGKGGEQTYSSPVLTLLGKWAGMTASSFITKVGTDAKDRSEKLKSVTLAKGKIETLKLAQKIKMTDEENKKTMDVNYFEAFGKKLVKSDTGFIIKGEKLEEDGTIGNGLIKDVLSKFGEDDGNKHAKVFVLYQLLSFEDKVSKATSKDVVSTEFVVLKQEIAKVKPGANGVFAKVDAEGNLEFIDLTAADKMGKKCVLSEKIYEFIENEVIKKIETQIGLQN